jgi:transposase-like protein
VTRPAGLPHEARVQKATEELLDLAREHGTRPSVLALARQFGLANTTFRRHFPDCARQVAGFRNTPPSGSTGQPGTSRYDQLIARNARLRRANRNLADHLAIAAANIQRLTLENQRLRRELEASAKVSRIGTMRRPGS